jgi:hypothetical protein
VADTTPRTCADPNGAFHQSRQARSPQLDDDAWGQPPTGGGPASSRGAGTRRCETTRRDVLARPQILVDGPLQILI